MSDDDALSARIRERDRQCGAGPDLHRELLPPDHPMRTAVPSLALHPNRTHIHAARLRAARPMTAAPATRRGVPWAVWVGSPNYTPGRDGHSMWLEPRYIVLHTMVGWESAARARFQQPSEQASSTYGVTLKGELFQYVSEEAGPWTNGTIYGPVGGNLDSITLEHEDGGDYDGPRTPELYAASARAVRDIADFYGIPLDRTHIGQPHELGHRECSSASTACPDALDIDRIIRMAAGGDVPVPAPVASVIPLGEQDMPLILKRANGDVDVVSAMPDGAWRHAVLVGGGPAIRVPWDDPLPGRWAGPPIYGDWNADESHLTMLGFGWSGGVGGSVWRLDWDAGDGQWVGPTRVAG